MSEKLPVASACSDCAAHPAGECRRHYLEAKVRELEQRLSDEDAEIERLKKGLAWYACGQHYELDGWEDCSCESPSFLFPSEPADDMPWMVEDGGVARAILEGAHMNPDEEADEIVIFPEAPK